jgi:Bacterial Ig domain
VADGQAVTGVVDWRVHTIGAVARVEFAVDGVVVAKQTREPWATTWDATNAAPGPHTLEARAYAKDGRSAVASVTVTR